MGTGWERTWERAWEVDFYRRPLQDGDGNALWELLICAGVTDGSGNSSMVGNRLRFSAWCPQRAIAPSWLIAQLQTAAQQTHPSHLPQVLQVFRPQTLQLLQPVAENLGLTLQPTRHTPHLKAWLRERATQYPHMTGYTAQPYDPLALQSPPPNPLPDTLWGEHWQFAAIPAEDIHRFITERPIRFCSAPEARLPLHLGLPSPMLIPGVVIEGGRRSRPLAQWLQDAQPWALNYVPGSPHGLILEGGLCDRWILATFDDAEGAIAAQTFSERQRQTQGLHFLLVQPDSTGLTYTGFWLLQSEAIAPSIP